MVISRLFWTRHSIVLYTLLRPVSFSFIRPRQEVSLQRSTEAQGSACAPPSRLNHYHPAQAATRSGIFSPAKGEHSTKLLEWTDVMPKDAPVATRTMKANSHTDPCQTHTLKFTRKQWRLKLYQSIQGTGQRWQQEVSTLAAQTDKNNNH